MKLEKIITLASSGVKLRFLAMERSLRATGCNLPLWVIPYNNQKFDLPDNAIWWEIPEVTEWLTSNNAFPATRKYQCFLTTNYQFVDSDIIFLVNPETVLSSVNGFITSCGHWHAPDQTYTAESLPYLHEITTNWQKNIFNSGQFACDQQLYTFNELKSICNQHATLLKNTNISKDQPAINMLVNLKKIPITNLTLPPISMESTFAADYDGVTNFERYWTDKSKKPYLIHWAGCPMDKGRPIDKLFINYLTKSEQDEWYIRLKNKKIPLSYRIRFRLSRIKKGLKVMIGDN